MIDFHDGTIDFELMMPGTITNAVAVPRVGSGSSSVGTMPVLSSLDLRASPNPFNPLTKISLHLEEASNARVAVFDLAGRLVRWLDQGHPEAGTNQARWNGRDESGRRVSSGAYQVLVETSAGMATTKIVLVK